MQAEETRQSVCFEIPDLAAAVRLTRRAPHLGSVGHRAHDVADLQQADLALVDCGERV